MESQAIAHHAHRCSFSPERVDTYLRLGAVTVFVRDQDQSLRFYLDQLGFTLVFDERHASDSRSLAVSPPDGTAILELVAPRPDSEESRLIGRHTQIVFLTENVLAKFDEWRERGVRFHGHPQAQPNGEHAATFEDPDGNQFTLAAHDRMTREIEEQRRAHVEMRESAQRASRELEIAKETQARLFPQIAPALQTLHCHAVCLQARHVGGDYYDFLDLGQGRHGLVIADISGKGTAAALLMANLQAHLHNLCGTYWNRPYAPIVVEQPERFLRTVNRLFYENTAEHTYTTLFFTEYDDATQRIRFANCGHPPALLVRADGEIERLDSTGTVLGLTKAWECGVEERRLMPGDVLALYTDGVTEAMNDGEEEFGETRLIQCLRRHRQQSPEVLVSALASEVKAFSPRDQHDDITLVAARCVAT